MKAGNDEEDTEAHPSHHGHQPMQAVEVNKPAQELDGLPQ